MIAGRHPGSILFCSGSSSCISAATKSSWQSTPRASILGKMLYSAVWITVSRHRPELASAAAACGSRSVCARPTCSLHVDLHHHPTCATIRGQPAPQHASLQQTWKVDCRNMDARGIQPSSDPAAVVPMAHCRRPPFSALGHSFMAVVDIECDIAIFGGRSDWREELSTPTLRRVGALYVVEPRRVTRICFEPNCTH